MNKENLKELVILYYDSQNATHLEKKKLIFHFKYNHIDVS